MEQDPAHPERGWPGRALILATASGPRAAEASPVAACVAVAATRRAELRRVLLADLTGRAPARPSLFAADEARELEAGVRAAGCGWHAAARGRICVARPAPVEEEGDPWAAARACAPDLAVVVCGRDRFRALLESSPGAAGAVLAVEPATPRALLAALARELRAEGTPLRAWLAPPGPLAARRALAGLEPGGAPGRRARRDLAALLGRAAQAPAARARPRPARVARRAPAEGGQALPLLLGLMLAIVAFGLILVALGGAITGKGRAQRAADLAAVSAARAMRDDFERLFEPARLADGRPNPRHLGRDQYLERAERAALQGVARNEGNPARATVRFPDRGSFAPTRVRVRIAAEVEESGAGAGLTTTAEAALAPPSAAGSEEPATASGGGYAGPLAYRQGKPMRPDVAAAFDRMAAAATRAGHSLVINSGFRSDAEQARLFAANPDPRMVAPPGRSLHRCGTELDLGPAGAYGWLAAHARRFGFLQRYSWEPWHFGFTGGAEPCSAAAERGRARAQRTGGDGEAAGSGGLPRFVPGRYRAALLRAASRHGVDASLLAAQLMAESNFNPAAVSPAGAQGIAQFMPGTAAAYGLRDPFDADAAIDAQARLMADLLREFGSTRLALAAYNAGPGAVAACGCVPAYPETQGYVARILGLLGGEPGGLAPPQLEVRLIE
jgi:hypothetical protein